MNEQLRQRMIDSVSEADDLVPMEKETSIHFAKGDDRLDVFTAESPVMKRLLAHPEFEIESIRQTTSDQEITIREDFEENFDGRRSTVGVQGTMPIGVLWIKSESRQDTGHARVASNTASDLRLSQRED